MTALAENLSPENLQNFVQAGLKLADGLFDQFRALQLSLPGLLVGAALCVLVLLFAVREAAAWFFKIDSIRRDLRRLPELTAQMNTMSKEVQQMQELMTELKGPISDCLRERSREGQKSKILDPAESAPTKRQESKATLPLNQLLNQPVNQPLNQPASQTLSGQPVEPANSRDGRQFPIVH